jgi:hypothetical protein
MIWPNLRAKVSHREDRRGNALDQYLRQKKNNDEENVRNRKSGRLFVISIRTQTLRRVTSR